MTKMRHASALLVAIAMSGVVGTGCSQGDPQGETAEASTEGLLLFKDPSQSGPRLDVYDFNGLTAISVGGPIGTESVLAVSSATESLDSLYRALHPEATQVPAELIALSDRVAPALAKLRTLPSSDAPPVTIDKSLSQFNSVACKNFVEGSVKYVPLQCTWSGSTNSRSIFNWPLNITAGDRTYGYNLNNTTATMRWWAADAQGIFYKAGQITLPANWLNWMSFSSGGPYFADIVLPSGVTGELGLTHHDYRFTF
ncbi:MAG TPA: hypothetical protein VG937_35045 [Polyangiaceae bacterium]|nr:hypothetical protein [Polyangiaceae bacterium]